MIDQKKLGTVIRWIPGANYFARWYDNQTLRFIISESRGLIQLPPTESEFYDVSLGTFCLNGCEFCYTSARGNGINYEDPSGTWLKLYDKLWYRGDWKEAIKHVSLEDIKTLQAEYDYSGLKVKEEDKDLMFFLQMESYTFTNAPFQIAIGSAGEPTEHPGFCEFLKTVYSTKVIPNYTTAGRILGYTGNDGDLIRRRDDILKASADYSSGVAVSLGNPRLQDTAFRAIDALVEIDTKVVLHHIIDTPESIDRMLEIREKYSGKIHYHVLLPLVKHGRSSRGMEKETYRVLMKKLMDLGKSEISDIAFGAKFIEHLKKWNPLGLEIFPEQTYSKNLILDPSGPKITPSSFDLSVIKEIKL